MKIIHRTITLIVICAPVTTTLPANADQPYMVEQFSGGRHRVKRIYNSDQNFDQSYGNQNQFMQEVGGFNQNFQNPNSFRQGFGNGANGLNGANGSNGYGNPNSFRQGNGSSNQNLPVPGGISFNNQNGYGADQSVRQPDKFADNPQIDSEGIRHFANGKHFDLSKMSLEQAIAETNSSTINGKSPRPDMANQFNNAGQNAFLPRPNAANQFNGQNSFLPRPDRRPRQIDDNNSFGYNSFPQSFDNFDQQQQQMRRQARRRARMRPDQAFATYW